MLIDGEVVQLWLIVFVSAFLFLFPIVSCVDRALLKLRDGVRFLIFDCMIMSWIYEIGIEIEFAS